VDCLKMLVTPPLVSDHAPLARTTSPRSGRVIWQQRYEGIAHVAYRGGKAVAGVSGPWSDRYVLIWWDERPPGSNPLELFETLEEAKHAVAKHVGRAMPEIAAPGEPRANPKRGWWTGIWPRRSHRRCLEAEIDLSGLHFSALR
jgi:hypothetical protein